ncbi:MAG TPA: tRNA (guanosine(46)-N7)-methyltransferase TrmB [Ruminococcaceae bacterium]|nr:tRNA (guanosine(46)-N7)-methyltransferase TrmB [Oscillospiraceae bacterium]
MRMRKKKHLEERLSDVGGILLALQSEDKHFKTGIDKKEYIEFKELFGNDNPVFLEIGCGKGKFAITYAKTHPDINLLAIEKEANVIVSACEKAIAEGVKNVFFVKTSAEYLEKYIKPGSIDGIFLNFSCPYPKKRYAPHRLTSENFLKIYKTILKDNAEIHQKTDNMGLFEFSIEQFSSCGFALKNVSLDVHKTDFENSDENIITEYEQRFMALNQPIYRLEAYIKK